MKRILIALAIAAFFCVGGHAQFERPLVQPQLMPYSYYRFPGYLQADSGILLPQRVANFTPKRSALIYDTGAARIKFYLNGWKALQDVAFTGSYTSLVDTPTNVTTQGNTFNGAYQLLQLDNAGKVYFANLPSTLMTYKGTWSAATNTPALANGTGVSGWMYQAIDSGVVDFGSGPITFFKNDYVGYNGSVWQWSPGNPGVRSVNGFQNIVSLTTVNIPEGGSVYYWTATRSRAAQSVTATGLTYDNSTGVISLTVGYTIPLTTDLANWNTAYSWGNWAAGTHYVGTTLIANNRASGAQTLTGVSIDGTAGSETLATVTGRGNATTNDITGGRIFSFQTNALIQAYDASGTSAKLRAYSGANYWDFAVKATSTLNLDFLGTTKVTIDNTGGITAGAISGITGTFTGNIIAAGYVDIGLDGTYGPGYVGIGFQGTTTGGINGQNRIFASRNGSDGIYLASATGMPVVIRPGGGTYDMVTVSSSNVSVNTTNPSSWTLGVGGGTGNGLRVYYGIATGNSIFDTYGDATYGGIARVYKIDGVTSGIILRGDGLITSAALAGSGNVIIGADNSGNVFKITIGSGLSYSGGILSATGGSSGTVTGSGTSGIIPLWNSASDIGNSVMSQSGGNVSMSGAFTAGVARIVNWVSDGTFARFGHSSYNTSTNYGVLQDASGNVYIQGTSVYIGSGGTNATTITSAGITTSVLNGAGTGLTGTASSLTAGDASRLGGYINNISVAIQSATIQAILGHDTNNNIYRYNASAVQTFLGLGSAAYTASSAYYAAGSTVANSTGWNSEQYDNASAGANLLYMLGLNGTTSKWSYFTASNIQSFLGLGSYAYRSSGLAELTGATFTGAVNGTTAYFTGTVTAGSFFEIPSDIRKKEVVQRWTSADGMDAIAYYLKDDISKKIMYGFEAQQVMKVLPTAVATHEDKTMPDGITYSVGYTQVLVYKIAMLEKRIENLENAIKK